MTTQTAPPRADRWTPAGEYRRLRATHPVRALRWLRNGALLSIIATLLLCLGVAVEARHQIAAAQQTQQAITDVDNASKASTDAKSALDAVFGRGDVTLTGTGNAFALDIAQVSTYVTAAAEGNAAGAEGEARIQFVQGQLATCIQLAETAVHDYSYLGSQADTAATNCLADPDQVVKGAPAPIADTGGLAAALGDLNQLETTARDAQLGSLWLNPIIFRWTLLVPPAVMLILVVATGFVLARHFRRRISPLLMVALLVTVAVAVAVGVFSAIDASDAQHLSADPMAAHPVTLVVASLLLTAAFVLTYLAYRPRLAEYRFPAS